LGAADHQMDFPSIYAIGKLGQSKVELDQPLRDLTPLLDIILEKVPGPPGDPDDALHVIVCNTTHDDYVGKLAVGRLMSGRLRANDEVLVVGEMDNAKGSIKKLFVFEGLRRVAVNEAKAGEVVAVAGLEAAAIGDSIGSIDAPIALPRIVVEEPTIK